MGGCREHGRDACCPRCTSKVDAHGFPDLVEANRRRRLKPCPLCKRLIPRSSWVEDWSHGVFACLECAHLRYGQLQNEYRDRLLVARDRVRRKRITDALDSVKEKRGQISRKLS